MSGQIDTIVWDLGGVLVDWNPLFVYHEQYFQSPADRDYFFSQICTSDWNEQQDAGYSLQQATADKLAAFPDKKWQQPLFAQLSLYRYQLYQAFLFLLI